MQNNFFAILESNSTFRFDYHDTRQLIKISKQLEKILWNIHVFFTLCKCKDISKFLFAKKEIPTDYYTLHVVYRYVLFLETGLPGRKGEPGDSGLDGYPGTPGYPGLPGLRGFKGAQGKRGIMGPRGLEGDSGRPGIAGPQGPKGEMGKLTWPDKLTRMPGDIGDKGFPGVEGPRGPRGQLGSRGDTGIQGPKGEKVRIFFI